MPDAWGYPGDGGANSVRTLSCLKTITENDEIEKQNFTGVWEVIEKVEWKIDGGILAPTSSTECDQKPEFYYQDDEDLYQEKAEAQATFQKKIEEEEWTVVKNKKDKKGEKVENVNILQSIEPEGVNTVDIAKGEWEQVELAVDSGATETVINEDMVSSVAVTAGPACKRGVKYEVANGVRIPNEGEKKFVGVSEESVARSLTAQVCDVNKGLLSVKKVVAAGNTVVFDESGSYIEDKITKEKMWLREDNGMYMLRLWVQRPF